MSRVANQEFHKRRIQLGWRLANEKGRRKREVNENE